MLVSGIKPIDRAKDALERLVLEPNTKKCVRALLRNSSGSFSEIIGGKSGGCVFLRHGELGQGKTLTAETVAEDLKRPLYSISVGELGTDPDQLEERLREMLDWQPSGTLFSSSMKPRSSSTPATRRTCSATQWSACSCACLIPDDQSRPQHRSRLLQPYLRRDRLHQGRHRHHRLAVSDLNGRQIKNVIRTAATLAKLDGEAVTTVHLKEEI
jgi:hypothetical protein